MKGIKGKYVKVEEVEWGDGGWECGKMEGLEEMKIEEKDDGGRLGGGNNYGGMGEG